MRTDPSRALGISAVLPSEIRQLDLLIELLEQRRPCSELLPVFSELDSILGSLYAIYLNELQFLADGEPQNRAADQIAKDFSAVRPLARELSLELTQTDCQHALDVAHELKEAVRQLFLSFGDLKQQAAAGPKYSELPFTQELLRVVHHYLKGRLPMSAVLERLDSFCNYHDNLEQTFENLIPNEAEDSVLQERREDLEEALALQLQGIEELDLALEERDDRTIKKAVKKLTVASEALYEIYQELERANNEVATVACLRCGAETPTSDKQCVRCGAQLPRFDSGLQLSTVELQEGALPTVGQPEELLRLGREVERALVEQDSHDLHVALESFHSRLASLKTRMKAMKSPPASIPSDHLKLLNEGKSLFLESVETLSNGYELLHEGATLLDENLLHQGLQDIDSGFALMREFQATFEEAERLTPRPATARPD